MRKLLTSLFLASLVTIVTSIVPVSAASSNASCVGTISSGVRGTAFDRDEGSVFVKTLAASMGVPPGDVYSDRAATKFGSVAVCLTAPPAP